MKAASMPMPEILHQDGAFVAIAKPAGWLTVPGRVEAPVLHSWAQEHLGKLWICHRLDRETSGALIFARTAEAHKQANEWFMEGKIKKFYLGLASGSPPAPVFRIRRPIESLPATTQVEVKEHFREGFLAQIRTLTGKRHQIRIHLSEEGCPLWGDPKYGGPREVRLGQQGMAITRVALHAWSLELPGGLKFQAPVPEDFSVWLSELRQRGSHA